jgi:anti-sigma factor RsiW
MHKDLYPFLNSYLDGELEGTQLKQMETHLKMCEICQNELKEFRHISELLHKAPAPEIRRADRFVTNLTLNLPRRSVNDQPAQPNLVWWLIPAGLLFAWFFIKATILVTDAVSVVGTAGFLGQTSTWLNGTGHQPLWFAVLNWISGGQAANGANFNLLNTVNGIASGFFTGFLWQTGVGLGYLGWVAVWWFKKCPQPMNGRTDQMPV